MGGRLPLRAQKCWVCGSPVVIGAAYGDVIYSCVDEGIMGNRDAIIGAVRQ